MRPWLTLFCLLLPASLAHAAGLNLAWDQCLPEGGVAAKKFACGAGTGNLELVGSFVPGQPHPRFAGCEFAVDVQSESPGLPDWWQFFNRGACRENALSASFDFTGSPQSGCTDPYGGLSFGGVGAYVVTNHPRPDYTPKPNAARILMAVVIENTNSLAVGAEYYGFRLLLGGRDRGSAGSCAGCSVPVCLTLTEAKIYDEPPPAPPGQQAPPPVFERLTSPSQSNMAAWQDAGPGCQSAVKNKSWGQLKTLYK